MPELPEVEITARRLSSALVGAEIESAVATGINTVKTFSPPLDALVGRECDGVSRVGKLLVVEFGDLSLLIHLMSAGRLQVFDKRASLRDKTSRILIRLTDGRELRLREFGSKQQAWVKLLDADSVTEDQSVASLGPEAWPTLSEGEFAAVLSHKHQLHTLLRDQKIIAGIGRTWANEILWTAQLSPFQLASDLDLEAAERLRVACGDVLGKALDHYETNVGENVPVKLDKPVKVHRLDGEPCPRCGTKLEGIHFKDYVIVYCPTDQTGGRLLKDRRMSKLLK